jgi:hypothetical protein
MSSLRDDMDPNNPLYYAPRRVRLADEPAVQAAPEPTDRRAADKHRDQDKLHELDKFQEKLRDMRSGTDAGRSNEPVKFPEPVRLRDQPGFREHRPPAEPTFPEPPAPEQRAPEQRVPETRLRDLRSLDQRFQEAGYRDPDFSDQSQPKPPAYKPQDFPPQNRDARARQPDDLPLPRRAAAPEEARRTAPPAAEPRPRSTLFEDAVSRALKESLEPEEAFVAPMKGRRVRRGGFSQVGRMVAAVAVAAVLALFFILVVPILRKPSTVGDVAQDSSMWQQIKDAVMPSSQRKAASTLLVADKSGGVNEPLELGVIVTSPVAGHSLVLSGLPTGSRLTAGKKVGANEWRIPAPEVATASVIPATDYVGQATISAELRNADGAALVGGTFRMTWTGTGSFPPVPPRQPNIPQFYPTPAQVAAPVAPIAVPQAPAPVVATAPAPAAQQATPGSPMRNIDPAEVMGMIRRAQDLAASGDFLPARLLLQRAAESRSARAAMMLAETYDPIALRKFANGPAPDVNMARNWYRRAQEWGLSDAQRQLDALQSY